MHFENRISNIAIIGAGPSGVAVAKYLLAEKTFSKIDIYEQRNRIGGIWNFSPAAKPATSIPQTKPQQPLERPIWHNLSRTNGFHEQPSEPVFETALYDDLETNIPHTLMQHVNKPFPQGSALFPRHEDVLRYLDDYAEDVKHLIKFETQVTEVRLHDHDVFNWKVTTQRLRDAESSTTVYDAVVVANGHYMVPYVPDIKGISKWNKAYQGAISHSKSYRNNEPFADQKVIVVGNSASGVDIASQIEKVSKSPLLCSQRSESIFKPDSSVARQEMCEIEEFLLPEQSDHGVRFKDGTIEEHVDHVLFATGYFYSYPFLSSLNPPIITTGRRANNIYKQMFHTHYPTLAFTILPLKVIPFPMSENQGAVMARVWSGRLKLPSKKSMQADEQKWIREHGNDGAFHYLKFPQDADYLNDLYDWASSASPERGKGLENDGMGKLGIRWDEKALWARERFPGIRKAYLSRGADRDKVRSIEELGFDFEKWKKEQELESKKFLSKNGKAFRAPQKVPVTTPDSIDTSRDSQEARSFLYPFEHQRDGIQTLHKYPLPIPPPVTPKIMPSMPWNPPHKILCLLSPSHSPLLLDLFRLSPRNGS
ncbi:MAG: hypothetical protein Q9160_001905 [Pyrenula sp. 1 TL-2023]